MPGNFSNKNELEHLNIVTGSFSYSGKYITRRLLAQGESVKTLTNHPNRPDPFAGRVSAAPYSFENPRKLIETLRGADTLYNTYWVRFGNGPSNFTRAVANSSLLFHCAKEAGVRRVVHVSIANAGADPNLPYFRGKGRVEAALRSSGLSYCILRPTVVFGDEDILINNIAWLLRKFPVFAIPGSGEYRLQPVCVEDLAEMAVAAGHRSRDEILDAVGPEIFSFNELVRLIAQAIGSRAQLIRVPATLSFVLSKMVGYVVRDKVLTWEEVDGLMASLLISRGAPTGRTKFSEWLRANAHHLGLEYAGELDRHFRRTGRASCPQCVTN